MTNIKEIMATHPNTSITLEVAPFSDALCKITASITIDERMSKLDILSAQTPEAVDAGNQRAISQLLSILGITTQQGNTTVPGASVSDAESSEPPKATKRRSKKDDVKVEHNVVDAPTEDAPTEVGPTEDIPAESDSVQDIPAAEDEVQPSSEEPNEPEPAAIETSISGEEPEPKGDAPIVGEAPAEEPVVASESDEELEAKREHAKTVLVEFLPGVKPSPRMASFVGSTVWEMLKQKRSFGPVLLKKAKDGEHFLTPKAEDALRIIVDMLNE